MNASLPPTRRDQHPAVRRLALVLSQLIAGWNSWRNAREERWPASPNPVASRQATILFTDVAGFSLRMASRAQAEVVASLDRYFEILSACVYRNGGRVDKFIGDGMMAVFDEADRAVQAAREIQAEVARFNTVQLARRRCSFPTRIAVDTGPVIVIALSAHPDRGQTVLGQAVNVAAHLAQLAPPERVFVSQSTCALLRNGNGCQKEQRLVVKGQPEPIVVFELCG